jgi:hypothetical protein
MGDSFIEIKELKDLETSLRLRTVGMGRVFIIWS